MKDELYGQCPNCSQAIARCECWLRKNLLNMTDEEKAMLAEIVRDAQARIDKLSLGTNAVMRDELTQLRAERASLAAEAERLRADVREATELLQEAYEQGMFWRGDRIYKWVREPGDSALERDAKGCP